MSKPNTAKENALIAIHNWMAAYKKAHNKEHARPTYSAGWITIPGSAGMKVRTKELEAMTQRLAHFGCADTQ